MRRHLGHTIYSAWLYCTDTDTVFWLMNFDRLNHDLPTWADVESAAHQLAGKARCTLLLSDTLLDETFGARIFLKCENLQYAGAFKFRGAWNTMSRLDQAQRSRGVVTHSSGNHAQAVALCGQHLGIPTTVVMPTNASHTKRQATEDYGALVVTYDPATNKREEITAALQREHDYVLVPPFDHPHVIAGQGTAARELIEAAAEPLEQLLVPCGGGGLLSGCALSARALAPHCRVIGVEPEQADDAARSFRSGCIERVDNPDTIADGTRTESLGKITFAIIQGAVDDIVTVPEAAIAQAVRLIFDKTRMVVEPSGALGIAALISGAVPATGRIGIILSGGNIDRGLMATLLSDT